MGADKLLEGIFWRPLERSLGHFLVFGHGTLNPNERSALRPEGA